MLGRAPAPPARTHLTASTTHPHAAPCVGRDHCTRFDSRYLRLYLLFHLEAVAEQWGVLPLRATVPPDHCRVCDKAWSADAEWAQMLPCRER